jgi:hypothetical protein
MFRQMTMDVVPTEAFALTPCGTDNSASQAVSRRARELCERVGRQLQLFAILLGSAWATEAGLTLGQVAVDEKSNKITAIPGHRIRRPR